MDELGDALTQVSLVTNHYGDGELVGEILQDWFRFLGGKPGQVVIVDGGSDVATRRALGELERAGLVDTLDLSTAMNPDVSRHVETAFIQEYKAVALARNPYILFFHADTLPYCRGHDDWLPSALELLQYAGVFAISGAFNRYVKTEDACPNWYWSDKCSLNFALMKRALFLAAIEEFAGDFVRSGFCGENPAHATGQDRYLIEVACEDYIRRHNLRTIIRREDATWTVFHTNTRGARLAQTRSHYFARLNIKPFLDAGANPNLTVPSRAKYYGQPSTGVFKRARIRFGQTRLGPVWRALKRRLGWHS